MTEKITAQELLKFLKLNNIGFHTYRKNWVSPRDQFLIVMREDKATSIQHKENLNGETYVVIKFHHAPDGPMITMMKYDYMEYCNEVAGTYSSERDFVMYQITDHLEWLEKEISPEEFISELGLIYPPTSI